MTDALFLSVEAATAALGDSIELTGDEGRHAAAVKRIRVGEAVLLADGNGRAVRCETTSVAKSSIVCRVTEVIEPRAQLREWVAVQALAKSDRSGDAVELLTQVGVSTIVAWQAARSVSRWDSGPDKRARLSDKWAATAREATKQARRFRVPTVTTASSAEVLDVMGEGTWFVLHESAETPVSHVTVPEGRVGVIVGPEGGISPEELRDFVAAGAQVVRISDGVLRTSTAGGVAIAQLQALAGA